MITTFVRRTMLMTPGNRLDRLHKANSYAADGLVFDLEDSVPPEEKSGARIKVTAVLKTLAIAKKELCVRINSLDTIYGPDDLAIIPWHLVDSIMVPKVEAPEHLKRLEKMLNEVDGLQGRNGPLEFIVIIETPRGIMNALAVADASERTTALFFGSGDYTSAMGAEIHADVLQFPRSVVCAAAGAKGIQAIDAAYFLQVKDAQATYEDACIARRFGFSGKVVFHPNQVDVVNDAFTPTVQQIAHAREIVEAYEDASAKGIGTLVINGNFVAVDLVPPARRLLVIAQRIKELQDGLH
jgi:citrate lyase subunit beta/citryl-CoA lyase